MSFATIATVALVASASFVSAAPVAARDNAPSGYYEGYLEDYDVYHARYIALDCKTQHNTTFFDECCHPLLANETVADSRPSYCSANATVTSSIASSIAEYTATATASASATADVEAESEYSSASSSVEEAASTASYDWVTESTTASSTSASASATLDAAAEYAHKTSSSSKHHTSTSTSSEAEWTASSTTSSSAAATSTGSSSGTVYTGGYATFFYQGGVAGECGTVHSDSDYVIAIDAAGWWSDYESNDNSPYCGKSITITNTNNGKSVTAVVADVCPTCVSNNSLDLSVGAFTAIASESDGQVPITWVWA